LRPQKTWSDAAVSMPVFFDTDSSILKDKLREQEEIVIIVPCQEGEEIEYVKNDPLLSTFAIE
jgi:hypothetical protein